MSLNTRVKHSASETGFTLIEIMLVLLLISILSAIAMPSLQELTLSTRLKSSARSIRDMLHFARDMAVTEGTPYLVVFDLDRNRYWLASSETFTANNLLTSSNSQSANGFAQLHDQTAFSTLASEMVHTEASRTSMILGVPNTLKHNISFSHMVTSRNSQIRQTDSGTNYVYFSRSATSEDTTLYIQNVKGSAVSIDVEASTGHVRIQDISSEERQALGLSITMQTNLN